MQSHQEMKNDNVHIEEETVKQILKIENSAGSIFCWLKTNARTLNLAFTKDVVGVVATLAKVESDDLSRPFVGGTIANDPQKKLAIPKPTLSKGECPPEFLDYAVNMIHLDSDDLSFLTTCGHGLRESLFYYLFSSLQVYRMRNEMLHALPCISDGALSLDGGMIKKCGMFALGNRNEVEVKFPLIFGELEVSPKYIQAKDEIRKLKWESFKLFADIQSEQQLLDYKKGIFTSQGYK